MRDPCVCSDWFLCKTRGDKVLQQRAFDLLVAGEMQNKQLPQASSSGAEATDRESGRHLRGEEAARARVWCS